MRTDEIRELGSDDIASRIRELEEERFRLRFRSATEPLEDPLRLRVIRRDVSRLKTILHERTLGIERSVTPREAKGEEKGKKEKKARRPAKKGATKTRAR